MLDKHVKRPQHPRRAGCSVCLIGLCRWPHGRGTHLSSLGLHQLPRLHEFRAWLPHQLETCLPEMQKRRRLDDVCKEQEAQYSKNVLQGFIATGKVFVNGQQVLPLLQLHGRSRPLLMIEWHGCIPTHHGFCTVRAARMTCAIVASRGHPCCPSATAPA